MIIWGCKIAHKQRKFASGRANWSKDMSMEFKSMSTSAKDFCLSQNWMTPLHKCRAKSFCSILRSVWVWAVKQTQRGDLHIFQHPLWFTYTHQFATCSFFESSGDSTIPLTYLEQCQDCPALNPPPPPEMRDFSPPCKTFCLAQLATGETLWG